MIYWILAFVLLLTAPLLVALVYYWTHKGDILFIRQNYTKDARYFGRSFSGMIKKGLPDMHDGMIHLSRDEHVWDADAVPFAAGARIDQVVVARNREFHTEVPDLAFRKEVFSLQDAWFSSGNIQLRAAYSDKRLLLGNGCQVLRWVDAENAVVAFDHCDLGISVSSGEQLVVGYDNVFQRLYAPVIRLGQRPDTPDRFWKHRDPKLFRLPLYKTRKRDIRYIGDDMAGEDGLIPFTVLTRHDLKMGDGLILQGDIHSDCSVRIMENAMVLGNIFAEKDVLLERGATVAGNVFTQGNITLESGACVGQPNKISSLVARGKIHFAGNNNVYGYVVAEAGGRVLPLEDPPLDNEGNECPPAYGFPTPLSFPDTIRFHSLEEYRNVDAQGFRQDRHILRAVIPEGAEAIPISQFFSCENLKSVHLPRCLRQVGDYAFADCGKLTTIPTLRELPLISIGMSAFENCKSLYVTGLPDSLVSIGSAAFAGCPQVKKLLFSETGALKTIGDHAFRDCVNLTEVWLPDQTEYVGISAFLGCTRLRNVSVPETLKDQPGVAELPELCPGVDIEFRKVIISNGKEEEHAATV